MKKIILLIILVPITLGAVCMSYSTYRVLDVIGFALMVIGGVSGTFKVLKLKSLKRLKIMLLCSLYLAIVLLTIAGSVLFSGTILFALVGVTALVIFRLFDIHKKLI